MQKWLVLWRTEEGKKFRKLFDGPKPTEAVQYAKELKRQDLKPSVISTGHAYPPGEKQELKRRPGMLWCPYCVKFRHFKLIAIKHPTYTSEAFMRCPVCLISTNEFWVKKYNGFLDHMTEMDIVRKLMKYEGISG